MNIYDRFKSFLAGTLTPVPFPKMKPKQQSLPGYRTNIEPKTSAVARNDRLLASTDRLSARTLSDTRKTVLELSRSSPDLSSAVSFMLRTGIPETFTAVARDTDGKINVAATALVQELIVRLTYLGNPDGSFTSQRTLQSLSEQLGMELLLYGAMCGEVALDKARIPASLNPISTTTIKMYEEDTGFRLIQDVGGTEIDLDFPTIIYVSVDQLQTELYASGYYDASIQPILADIDFNNDLRRALKRSILPKIKAVIDSDKVKKGTPPDILADSTKLVAYRNSLMQEISDVLSNANPEDAIVSYDTVEYEFLNGGQDPGSIVERVQKVLNGKLASGAKTLPVVLGHSVTSNAASTESLLYVKQANMLRVKLNEFYSRALTVAVRVLGNDCYVQFVYDEINLRPEGELESFYAMKQSRNLQLLSLGLISDEECCLILTGNLPPAGYKPLAGTQFMTAKPADTSGNPTSNTSAIDQTLTGDAPKAPKSGS